MAYYFDHKRTREDNPAAHVDSLATIYMVYLAILIGVILTIAVSFAGLGNRSIYVHMLISAVQVSLLAYYWMHLYRAVFFLMIRPPPRSTLCPYTTPSR